MKLLFEKYHGAGNDFILIHNSNRSVHLHKEQIALLCNRRSGIGADGLILIQKKEGFDFEMVYYNADGGLGSMCGNGGRCAVIFAAKHGIIRQSAKFAAFDGEHDATITGKDYVKLSMLPVNGIQTESGNQILFTGSPHIVKFVDSVTSIDVVTEGRNIRNSESFKEQGINVNFVSENGDNIQMRTYERGVEDETLSCGTGTVAAAIALSERKGSPDGSYEIAIQALGGLLKVYFTRQQHHFINVWLEGPVAFVFEGSIEL